MRFKINFYLTFSILIFHVFNFSFSQSELTLSNHKKEIQKNKNFEKKLENKIQNG